MSEKEQERERERDRKKRKMRNLNTNYFVVPFILPLLIISILSGIIAHIILNKENFKEILKYENITLKNSTNNQICVITVCQVGG